jgi:flagellar hook-associated protein 2
MPVINFSGLASGIDTNALIDATSQATRQRRIVPLQKEVTELTETNDVLKDLKNKLSVLQTKLRAFSALNGGGVSKQVTSSNESVLTGTASNAAANNTYSVSVSQLARQSTVSFNTTYASSSAALIPTINDGNTNAQRTLTVTFGTGSNQVQKNFILTSTTTVSEFVASFNEQFTGTASASLVNVGTPSNPSYKILITSNNQGLDKGQVTFSLDPSPDAALSAWTSNKETSQALNSQFTVSGISGTIERSSNTVNDLITGVTFSLQGTGSSTVQIGTDTATTKAKVKEFVDAYNDVIRLINENDQIQRSQSNKGEITNTFLPLASTSLDNNLVLQLRTALSAVKSHSLTDAEADEAGLRVRILADIGITTTGKNKDGVNDGTLVLAEDSSAGRYNLESALQNESNSVSQLLQNLSEEIAGTGKLIDQYIGFNRLIDTSVNNNSTRIDRLNDEISDAEKFILEQEAQMRQRFASLESLMSRLQNQQAALTSALAGLGKK